MSETKRLYFEDAGRLEFEARITGRRTVDGRPAVILDETAFYPESGGQPWDLGTIDGIPVVKVLDEEGTIVHVLEREPGQEAGEGAEKVKGLVDGRRRFDHMRQHSGQHVLSQAFIEILNGETRSFHLGADASTLEIGIENITDETLDRVERRANEVVFEDRAVKTYFVPAGRIAEIPLRRPPKVSGLVRVVEIEGFDYSACGGTHVRRTGEIGLIKIIAAERIRGNLRFTFVCGGRALADYQVKTRVCRGLAGKFNVPDREIPAAVEKQGAELKDVKKRLKTVEQAAAGYEARELAEGASGRIVARILAEKSPEGARALALSLVKLGPAAAVFATRSGGKARLVLARADGVAADLRPLAGVLAPLFNGKGGGGPSLIEIAGDQEADLDALVARASSAVAEEIGRHNPN
ncbi:MAG TPA: alanine--tRNA ligase-related protein [Candidatus Aminicenantes bacterium]|nr:alanine--tRNA ligase-related protein [Candidatus Aminicenantes bacterium]